MFDKYDIYTEIKSLYCYKESHVLYNKFHIKDYNTLKNLEADITTVKINSLTLSPINGRFTCSHLCNIHRYIFEDIYRFAGHFRRETIKKGDTTFLSATEIPSKLRSLLKQLKDEKYLSAFDHDTFTKRLAYYFAELNYIHPFREGNGRAIREFIRQLCVYNGYDVDWSFVKPEAFLEAIILSVYDNDALVKVLIKCVTRP